MSDSKTKTAFILNNIDKLDKSQRSMILWKCSTQGAKLCESATGTRINLDKVSPDALKWIHTYVDTCVILQTLTCQDI